MKAAALVLVLAPALAVAAATPASQTGTHVAQRDGTVSGAASGALAGEFVVRPGQPLQALLDAAPAGSVLRLAAGHHAGPLRISRSVVLMGEPGAVIVGPGQGSVVTVSAPDVRIEGLEIRGSGKDGPAMDSAVLLERSAVRAQVRGNALLGNLFGVYIHGAADAVVEGSRVRGREDVRLSEAGNGVSIWNAPGARVLRNDFRKVRDGIYVKTSARNVFADNIFRDLRFAIHYMYTHDSRIERNRSLGNHVAWAIMYSERLEIRDNVSEGDRDHGLMLNSTNHSTVVGNVVRGGGEKCVFVYASAANELRDNWFEGCPIGIHFTAGSERNTITGNAFVGNRNQVKYVGTRLLDWAHEGRGNYWSDNPAFDLDGDGIADRPYRPNDVMDAILWRLPAAKLLATSPAVQVVRWAQARFPALYPGGVVDSAPLMRPARTPTARPSSSGQGAPRAAGSS